MKRNSAIPLLIFVIVVVFVAFFAIKTFSQQANWKISLSTQHHSGKNWEINTQTPVVTTHYDANHFYIIEESGKLHAVNKFTASEDWVFHINLPNILKSKLVAHGDLLITIVESTNKSVSRFIAIDKKNGNELWSQDFSTNSIKMLNENTGLIEEINTQTSSSVSKIDLLTGKKMWSIEIPEPLLSDFIESPRKNIILGRKNVPKHIILFSIDANSGQLLWSENYPDQDGFARDFFATDLGIILSSQKIQFLDLETGMQKFPDIECQELCIGNKPVLGDQDNFFLSEKNLSFQKDSVFAANSIKGKIIWKYDLPSAPKNQDQSSGIISLFLYKENLIIIRDNTIISISQETGEEIWKSVIPGYEQGFAQKDNNLFVVSRIPMGKQYLLEVDLDTGIYGEKMQFNFDFNSKSFASFSFGIAQLIESPVISQSNVYYLDVATAKTLEGGSSSNQFKIMKANLIDFTQQEIGELKLGEKALHDKGVAFYIIGNTYVRAYF